MSSNHSLDADQIWSEIRKEAEQTGAQEPMLSGFLDGCILGHNSFKNALCCVLSSDMASPKVTKEWLQVLFREACESDPTIVSSAIEDLRAHVERDPASQGWLNPFLYFKGFHALQIYRFAHYLYTRERTALALYLQSRVAQIFDVDIHPAARIGKGIMIDHATGLVIGETAVVEDDVSMLHGVTLGGTGKQCGDRHPKIRRGVLIAAGAKILGNIEVGVGAKVGASSLVLEAVPPHTTVAGVPAKIVGRPLVESPAFDMHHELNSGD